MTKWRTKTGKEIAVEDMTTNHIESCVQMLEPRATAILDKCIAISKYIETAPEGAADAAAQEFNAMMDEDWSLHSEMAGAWVKVFQRELGRRKEMIDGFV